MWNIFLSYQMYFQHIFLEQFIILNAGRQLIMQQQFPLVIFGNYNIKSFAYENNLSRKNLPWTYIIFMLNLQDIDKWANSFCILNLQRCSSRLKRHGNQIVFYRVGADVHLYWTLSFFLEHAKKEIETISLMEFNVIYVQRK